MAVLRASGLVKDYETTRALDGVDLSVEAGEVRGLLGPNGAGKTTLLRILLGLVAPNAGTVSLLDQPARPGAAVPDGVAGFVEDPSFYPYLSGRANLELLAELDGPNERATVDEVLEQVALAPRAGERVSGYSTGMRQRLGIAAALLRRPRLLLLDEPTSGLDPGGARDVRQLVGRLAAQGVAVLLSSHLIAEVQDVCDSFSVLRRGTLVWEGTAAQLRAQAPPSSYRLHTSDDARAEAVAAAHEGVQAAPRPGGELELTAAPEALDAYVLALGGHGVAVRRLEQLVGPLEAMFFLLTDEPAVTAAAVGA